MKDGNRGQGPAVSRRSVIAGAGAMGLGMLPGLTGMASAQGLPRSGTPDLPATPQENLINLVRMTASLDPVDTPWFFNGSIYAVIGDAAPVELMRVQGMETYRMLRRSADSFMMHGLTVTFMTDVETGEWLHEFRNPFTEELLEVPVHAATTPPGGGHVYATRGVRPASALEKIPDAALDLWWTAAGDFVWLHNETVYPPGLSQPRKQRQSNVVNKAHFFDPDIRALPAAFTVSFWSPWSSWMSMDNMPGHLIWHATGAKLNSVADLPQAFRQRVEKEHPDMLAVKVD